MRSVGISESRSYGGCGAIPAVYHQQQRGKSTRGSGASQREHDEHKDGAMVPPQRNERTADRWRKSRPMVRGVDTQRRPI